jgi:hypothetical protein
MEKKITGVPQSRCGMYTAGSPHGIQIHKRTEFTPGEGYRIFNGERPMTGLGHPKL